MAIPKQESVFSATVERIAIHVTPDWGLGPEGTWMIGEIHVEIGITSKEEKRASRQWGISWCSENNAPLHIFERVVRIWYTQSFQRKLLVTMMSRSKLSCRQTLYTYRPNVFFLSRQVNREPMGIMFVMFDQEYYRAVCIKVKVFGLFVLLSLAIDTCGIKETF